MKLTKTILALLFLSSITLSSCGGEDKETEKAEDDVKEETTVEETTVQKDVVIGNVNYSEFKIDFRDKKYFKLVDGSSDITLGKYGNIEVTADFELLKTFTGKIGEYQTEQGWIVLKPMDENGGSIKDFSYSYGGEMRSGDSHGIRLVNFLRDEPGTKLRLTFTGGIDKEDSNESDEARNIEAGKIIKSFRVETQR